MKGGVRTEQHSSMERYGELILLMGRVVATVRERYLRASNRFIKPLADVYAQQVQQGATPSGGGYAHSSVERCGEVFFFPDGCRVHVATRILKRRRATGLSRLLWPTCTHCSRCNRRHGKFYPATGHPGCKNQKKRQITKRNKILQSSGAQSQVCRQRGGGERRSSSGGETEGQQIHTEEKRKKNADYETKGHAPIGS